MAAKSCMAPMASMATELVATATTEEISILRPSSFPLSSSRGTFITMFMVPTGRMGIRKLMIWARPLKPPMGI